MKRNLGITCFIIFTFTFFASCSKINGKIEKRANGQIFLVNTSLNNKYKFTVKRTEIKNDTIETYSTEIIQLAPGDEVFLADYETASPLTFPTIEKSIFRTLHSNVSETEIGMAGNIDSLLKKMIDSVKYKDYSDTILNRQKTKFWFEKVQVPDSAHPFFQNRFKNEFKITGQIQI